MRDDKIQRLAVKDPSGEQKNLALMTPTLPATLREIVLALAPAPAASVVCDDCGMSTVRSVNRVPRQDNIRISGSAIAVSN
jgi:hypothetical protein